MKTAILRSASGATLAAALMLFAQAFYPAYSQAQQSGQQGVEPEVRGSPLEGSSANLKLLPSQERIPRADEQPRIDPAYIIPPIGPAPSSTSERRDAAPAAASAAAPATPPVSRNTPQFKAPLVNSLERGKWYVQIGAYSRADHAEAAISRAGPDVPVVVLNVGTSTNPMFRVLLGPFSQNESKTVLRRFKDKGYDAFLRSG